MRGLTTDKALTERIEELEGERWQDTWSAEEEQTLFFLKELDYRRKADVSAKIAAQSRDFFISQMNDKMQDEKKLLIGEYR